MSKTVSQVFVETLIAAGVKRVYGVVGAGQVGGRLVELLRGLGWQVWVCDPPRQAAEGGDFVDLERIVAECEVISLHTPLDAGTRRAIPSTRHCGCCASTSASRRPTTPDAPDTRAIRRAFAMCNGLYPQNLDGIDYAATRPASRIPRYRQMTRELLS